jgi:hypothetical protein
VSLRRARNEHTAFRELAEVLPRFRLQTELRLLSSTTGHEQVGSG